MKDKISSNHTLIPFGLHKDSDTIVDIHDVPKGKACDCICPSCHTSLIAKQGDINEWHFAHLSNKDAVNNVKDICEYSFYTSVRLMALQLISQNLKIDLPSYDAVVTDSYNEIYIKEEFKVTERNTISLNNIEVNKNYLGHNIDIIGKVQDYSFIMLLNYPNKIIPLSLIDLDDNKCGMISISLEPTKQLFSDANKIGKSYKDILNNYLQTDLNSKTWIYHPKYKQAEFLARQRLKEKKKDCIKNYKPDINSIIYNYKLPETESSNNQVRYKCTECNHQWNAMKNKTICPICGNHLYTFEIKSKINRYCKK
ncbi:MAG: hypothetical protein KZQ64_16325 [gamma proteobacterium symbiont of Bathyaustriella thionipta]|nr:hypothetical protein [gamma proteobacterium symbiont of Bathyaustriella thionipta]MCU7951099.1 hypothetical protein [gamma proteobacterium symbiont of Bathyaustriella thionipta]MCU7954933.1 hypothetical protein [gamma proteobacterium symbiont of Bathyaustriella thionipta]MCU7957611.1 hypothetical protein [gamma proteobacterium symbiont of Bathyaustriella thionipta]MCU7968210.1 hypothetical protein [gamma proteobacterium symbiont of Bathyaustriella thionipta]